MSLRRVLALLVVTALAAGGISVATAATRTHHRKHHAALTRKQIVGLVKRQARKHPGPTGPTGPVGPAAVAKPLYDHADVGAPLHDIYVGHGVRLQADCAQTGVQAVSTGADGVMQASGVDTADKPFNQYDNDADTGDSISLLGSSGGATGIFVYTSPDGHVTTITYMATMGATTAQGDCVVAGTVAET